MFGLTRDSLFSPQSARITARHVPLPSVRFAL